MIRLVRFDVISFQFWDAYDEKNTGALDLDDIEGHKDEAGAIMSQVLSEYEKKKAEERVKPEFITTCLEERESDDDEGKADELLELEEPKEKWDAESILSTYSNIYHHPKLISEPSKKVGASFLHL